MQTTFFIKNFSRLVIVLLVIQLSACTGALTKPLEEPKVFVRNFQITDVSLAGIEGVIGLDIDNPNDVNLNANGLTYQMSISDKEVLTGQKDESISIPSLGSKTIELPVRISYLALLEIIPQVMQKGSADYLVTGSIKTKLFQSIPFTKEGEFKVPLNPALNNLQ
ncbi:MAG: LEA type 2 family protein [Pseudomonadota bacterium]